MMLDGQKFGEGMSEIIRDYVERNITPLTERIAKLESDLAKLRKDLGDEE